MSHVNEKQNDKDIFDRIINLRPLRPLQPFYRKYKEQLLYLLFGALTTIVNLATFAFCSYSLHIKVLISNIIAWVVGVIFAYVTNRIWVFASEVKGGSAVLKEIVSFTAGRLATLLMEEMMLWVGIDLLGINSMVVKVIAQIAVIVGNYIVSKLFVFKK